MTVQQRVEEIDVVSYEEVQQECSVEQNDARSERNTEVVYEELEVVDDAFEMKRNPSYSHVYSLK